MIFYQNKNKMEKKPVFTNGILLRDSIYEAKESIEWVLSGYSNDISVVEYWRVPLHNKTIASRKASWPIYNEKLENLNPYSNGIHEKRIKAQKKIRIVMKKK